MSDITLRLDGLILILAIFASGTLYAVATCAALLAAWLSVERRLEALHMARRGGVLVLICLFAAIAAGVVFENLTPPTSGPDIIDWLAVPWALLFVVGCVWLARAGRSGAINPPSP